MNWHENLQQYARNVHSQAGEDGILEHIFKHLGITKGFLVDLGASPDGASNSNTRKLRDEGWESFLVDGGAGIGSPICSFWITRDNINTELDAHKVPREVDLLSLDLDGNDWWIWQAMQLRSKVAVVEVNPQFPVVARKTIAYNPEHKFDGTMYYGASLGAFVYLAHYKGMRMIYHNYLNAIFVDQTLLPANYSWVPLVKDFKTRTGHAPDGKGRPWVEV